MTDDQPNEARDTHRESSTFGSAKVGGTMKVYYDATDPDEARAIVADAISIHFAGRADFQTRSGGA